MSRITPITPNTALALYNRYLRGVDWQPALKSIPVAAGGAYEWFTTGCHLSPNAAAVTTALFCLLLLIAYLRIPKKGQALAANLIEDALAHQQKSDAATAAATRAIEALADADGKAAVYLTNSATATDGTDGKEGGSDGDLDRAEAAQSVASSATDG